MRTDGQVLSGVAATRPFLIDPLVFLKGGGEFPGLAGLLPAIICTVSAGGVLTYNVEITGYPNPTGASGEPWNVADNGSALTAGANLTFAGAVIAVRARITAYTSGTLDVRVIQP